MYYWGLEMAFKKCTECGKDFRPLVGNQKKCVVCKKKKRPTRSEVEVICTHCGKKFMSAIYNRKYCSAQCRERHNYKPREIEKVCEICGNSFLTTTNKRKFCSAYCSKVSYSRSLHEYYERLKLAKDKAEEEAYKKLVEGNND